MSQSEKVSLESILARVRARAQELVSKPKVAEEAAPPPKVTTDPELIAVRGYLDDIRSGRYDPRQHPAWEHYLIN
jgi:hypothetical protein